MTYSRKDFTGQSLQRRTDMSNQDIVGSCFSQEKPNTPNFPASMTGTTLRNCNLMNCQIPPGNTVIDCQTTQFEVQNDGHDWEIDDDGNPLCVMDYLWFYKNGITHPNPRDIPDVRVDKPINYRDPARNVRAE